MTISLVLILLTHNLIAIVALLEWIDNLLATWEPKIVIKNNSLANGWDGPKLNAEDLN